MYSSHAGTKCCYFAVETTLSGYSCLLHLERDCHIVKLCHLRRLLFPTATTIIKFTGPPPPKRYPWFHVYSRGDRRCVCCSYWCGVLSRPWVRGLGGKSLSGRGHRTGPRLPNLVQALEIGLDRAARQVLQHVRGKCCHIRTCIRIGVVHALCSHVTLHPMQCMMLPWLVHATDSAPTLTVCIAEHTVVDGSD